MKYANFCNMGRTGVNIGDYLQFIVNGYLLRLMQVPEEEIVYLGFQELAEYAGEDVIFPFCYSIIDFVKDGKLVISEKIHPVFLAVTLSTVDKFMDVDLFLEDEDNRDYLIKNGPIGCRDEITYGMLCKHKIPAYINGCMTAIFPRKDRRGEKVLFVDAPRSLLPYIPEELWEACEFSTQQYYFSEEEIKDYKQMFRFVCSKYEQYVNSAKLAVTSRLHVALPLAAMGIPVVLAKDNIDGRFSFIERYIPIYGKEDYANIDWMPESAEWEEQKALLTAHALGRLQKNVALAELEKMEQTLTEWFQKRKTKNVYKASCSITHHNGERFDAYAKKYWKKGTSIKYAFWGISENNLEYWKNHIEWQYPEAELVAIFDSFREGTLWGFPYRRPEQINEYPGVYLIVCSVGAAQPARKLFRSLSIPEERYCITSDCFIGREDAKEKPMD